jgi:lipoate-protein ligase A
MLIVESTEQDVHRNLALEEMLLEEVRGQGPVLFLWRSGPAVVIGRNQNPWRECAVRKLTAAGLPLARRVSGGGTVWHDPGYLNYAVTVPRETYDADRIWSIVLHALRREGIAAGRVGKSNLCVDGRKFSGTAFAFKKGYVLHHGTLLAAADLVRLKTYLQPDWPEMETRAVSSVPAPVVNLSELRPDLSPARLAERLKAAFCEVLDDGTPPVFQTEAAFDSDAIEVRRQRHRSAAWLYEQTPPFELNVSGRHIKVRHGRVTESGALQWVGRNFADLPVSATR